MFNEPILVIIFNRPEFAQKLLGVLRQVRPARLFVAADGPRPDHSDDIAACRATREVFKHVDWPCEIKTLYQEKNLGCGSGQGSAPETAINWFFDNVEQGIILEDDCIPSLDFFRFCEELLEYYRDNPKIMHIGGNNYQYGKKWGDASYYFSVYSHIWGWATWGRAWQNFKNLPVADRVGIWDAQWQRTIKLQHGLCITPNSNLVSNIGFGAGATHTGQLTKYTALPAEDIKFPLKHSERISRNIWADYYTFRHHYGFNPFAAVWQKIKVHI
jgi:hypothetical protein